ncbi:MAG: protein-disulfide isomerase [Thermodesulfovibrio sp.]|nr:protein-disulfide isomerase [Thermodesulfovibrio sp.]
MRKILFFAVMALILNTGTSSAFSTKGQDCTTCHSLKKEEAVDILKNIMPNVKVKDVKVSPIKAMWEVEFEADAKKGLVYIDFSKRYAVSGSILDIKEKKNLTQDRYADINRVDVSKIPLKDALLLGNKDAKNKIIVFTDPDCPFCVKLHAEIKKVVAERKDIAFQIKLFPLPMHKDAFEKSKAIVCEKSLQMLEDAFEKKPIAKAKCKTKAIDENIALAKKFGINGTPALILPNGKVSSGFRDAAAIKEMIDKK